MGIIGIIIFNSFYKLYNSSLVKGVFYRGNFQRNGIFKSSDIIKKPSIKWSIKTTGHIWNSPCIYKDIAYFGSYDGYIYAVTINNGSILWKNKISNELIWSSPIIVENTVFVGSSGGLYGLNYKNGKEIWYYQTRGKIHSSPVFNDNSIYFSDNSGTIYSIDYINKEKNWEYNIGRRCSSPTINDDFLIIGTKEDESNMSKIILFNINKGNIVKEFSCIGGATEDIAIKDSFAFWGTDFWDYKKKKSNGYFYKLSLEKLKLIWQKEMNGVVSTGASIKDSVVFFGVNYGESSEELGGEFFALDNNTGNIIWSYKTQDFIYSSPSLTDNIVYFGCDCSNLFALNISNGTKLWDISEIYNKGGPIKSSPVLYKGEVYFGGFENNTFYALSSQN